MLAALSDLGRADVAYGIVNQKGYPGWGYMLDHGATTLWEHWAYSDNVYSHNHPMFGSVSGWFFKSLAGIQPAPDAVGFNKVVVRPCIVGDLTSAAGEYDSVRGPVTSSWRKVGKGITLDVSIPVGVTATIYVPAASADLVSESGKPAAEAPGVEYRGAAGGEVIFRVGSGRISSPPRTNRSERPLPCRPTIRLPRGRPAGPGRGCSASTTPGWSGRRPFFSCPPRSPCRDIRSS